MVPELAKIAAHVTVFQRTPPWMVPKDDRPFTAAELARFRRSRWASKRERWRLWKEQHDFTALRVDDPLVAGRQGIAEDFLQRKVSDPALRAALTLDYPFRCKRVLLGSDYYAALQRDNTDLVTEPIVEITESAVVTGSRVTDVDAVVLATGFQTNHYLAGIEVIGADGQSLHERWGEDPSAYLGWRSAGSPTSSCSTGPTPTRAGTRSFISSRRAPAWWPTPSPGSPARAGACRCVRRPSAGSTTRSAPNSNTRYGPGAAATFAHRADGSSPSGRTKELEYARRTWRLRSRDWTHDDYRPDGQVPMTASDSRRSSS